MDETDAYCVLDEAQPKDFLGIFKTRHAFLILQTRFLLSKPKISAARIAHRVEKVQKAWQGAPRRLFVAIDEHVYCVIELSVHQYEASTGH